MSKAPQGVARSEVKSGRLGSDEPKATGTQVATANSNQLPANFTDDDFASLPTGMENVTSRDLIIPRLTILQALSPQLNKAKPEYIKGAEAGMFCDTATGDLFNEIELLPVYYAMVYLEWAPRSTGKGLVANHGTDASCLAAARPDDKRRMVLPNGNYIAETATYFVLNLTAGGRPSFIPLTSTQLKSARKWMTLLANMKLKRSDGSEFTPPIFFQSWKATVAEQSNNEGSWFGWKFEPGTKVLEIDPTKGLLERARKFCDEAREGIVQGDLASLAGEGNEGGGPSTQDKDGNM